MIRKPRMNKTILASIPLKRKFKRYWISKFNRMVENNGLHQAIKSFKNLSEILREYRSDALRYRHKERYIKRTGFRSNGMLKQMFEYTDSYPNAVFNFLKLYSLEWNPSLTVDEQATAAYEELQSISVNTDVPRFLAQWIMLVLSSYKSRVKRFRKAINHRDDVFHRLAINHSQQEWNCYWSKWHQVLMSGKSCPLRQPEWTKQVFPEIYKDSFVGFSKSREEVLKRLDDPNWNRQSVIEAFGENYSRQYQADFADLVSIFMYGGEEDCPFSLYELDFIESFLSEECQEYLDTILMGEMPFEGLFKYSPETSGLYVGHMQHLRKKGGGDTYRDIACINRFIQAALEPSGQRLYTLLSMLPCDGTFDQKKFDQFITHRVTNRCLYAGSVDLHHATDYLPRSWGEFIVDKLFEIEDTKQFRFEIFGSHGSNPDRFTPSWLVFKTVSRAKWEDEGYLQQWLVGQPLGSFNSFAMLGITHNFFSESLSAHLGYSHSPYRIVGDDIIITNKKLRKAYIKELTNRRIPLSLNKSYDGDLSEFTGRIFIRNAIPFSTPDQSYVDYVNIFDWQNATGIRIPWKHLSKKVKRTFANRVSRFGGGSAPSVYGFIQSLTVNGAGTHTYPFSEKVDSDSISAFFASCREDDDPEGIPSFGITKVANTPVILMNPSYANKNGYFMRYRPAKLPKWYKDKIRPFSTDSLVRAACECGVLIGKSASAN